MKALNFEKRKIRALFLFIMFKSWLAVHNKSCALFISSRERYFRTPPRPPLPLRFLHPPLPPFIFTGFKPVTYSASNALNSDSYRTLPGISCFNSISLIFFRTSSSSFSLEASRLDSSVCIAFSTHFLHRAFSFFAS